VLRRRRRPARLRVADALGMARVLVHPLAGVLSAYGMGLADQIAMREASVEQPLDDAGLAAARIAWCLGARPRAELTGQGVDRRCGAAPPRARALPGHRHGAGGATPARGGASARAFEAAYRQRFAFLMPGRALVIEAVSVEAVAAGERRPTRRSRPRRSAPACAPSPIARVRMHAAGWLDAGLFVRESLRAGATIDGPAIIAEKNATTVVEPGWQAVLTAAGPIELQPRGAAPATQHAIGTDADPVMLEVFNNLFMNIAEQMGLRLQNTAYSVNIKERLDFSCALFDADGS
jgi:5-oxoprolinase (ATP-hydrolysing)